MIPRCSKRYSVRRIWDGKPTVYQLFMLLGMLLLLSVAGSTVAQDIFGRIAGTITDTSGAVVANAKVTLTNESTQISREVTADKNGYFVADQLPAGLYSVT